MRLWSARRGGHLREARQSRVEMVPREAARGVDNHLRLKSGWIIQASSLNHEKVGDPSVRRIARRATGRTKGASSHVAAIARLLPLRRLALQLYRRARKSDMRSVACPRHALAVSALTV